MWSLGDLLGTLKVCKERREREEKKKKEKEKEEEKRREKQKVKGIAADTMYIGEKGRSSSRHVRHPSRYAEKEGEEKKEE